MPSAWPAAGGSGPPSSPGSPWRRGSRRSPTGPRGPGRPRWPGRSRPGPGWSGPRARPAGARRWPGSAGWARRSRLSEATRLGPGAFARRVPGPARGRVDVAWSRRLTGDWSGRLMSDGTPSAPRNHYRIGAHPPVCASTDRPHRGRFFIFRPRRRSTGPAGAGTRPDGPNRPGGPEVTE